MLTSNSNLSSGVDLAFPAGIAGTCSAVDNVESRRHHGIRHPHAVPSSKQHCLLNHQKSGRFDRQLATFDCAHVLDYLRLMEKKAKKNRVNVCATLY